MEVAMARVLTERLGDNVRLVNSEGRVDCSWVVRPGDEQGVERAFDLLAAYRLSEPASGWRLQTRGTIADWHDWASE